MRPSSALPTTALCPLRMAGTASAGAATTCRHSPPARLNTHTSLRSPSTVSYPPNTRKQGSLQRLHKKKYMNVSEEKRT